MKRTALALALRLAAVADPSSTVQLLGPRTTCNAGRVDPPRRNQLVVAGAAAVRPHQQVVDGG
jgi:hypothetical protein